MKGNIGLKIFSFIMLTLFLFCTGFIGVFITAFAGGEKFYTPLVMVITAGLIVLSFLWIFKLIKGKTLRIMTLSFFGVCLLATAIYAVNRGYRNSIPTVNDQGVNLHQYEPFLEETKAVKLDEPSTLKLEASLPRLDGATALYPLYSAFARAVYPEKAYNAYQSEVMCSNTVGSYENLIRGEVDIIFAARPSKQQLEDAKNAGKELKLIPIGREAFVFFVNSKNNVAELSTSQIQDIYSGKITNWQEVGGKSEKIRAFQRPENSGSQTMLEKLMEGKSLMVPPKEDIVSGMGGIIEQTASYRNYKNAIGYSFLFFATEMVKNNQIKLLKIDGVYPDRNTIKNKEYPLTADFYAVTSGSTNPNVEKFIEWILSPQGQSLVEKTGYTPVINK